jgi:hypothetical protein
MADENIPPIPPPGAGFPPIEPVPEVKASEVPAPLVPAPVAPTPAVPVPSPAYGQPQPYAPQPAGQPQPYAQQPYGQAVAPKGLSITSMILGILGAFGSLFSLGFVPAVVGVVLGFVARKSQPHAKTFWMTGIITGFVGIGISALWLFLFVLVAVVGLD